MILSYPAIFYHSDESVPYGVYFPDFDGITQGETMSDALEMASDYLGIYMGHLIDNEMELPSTSDIHSLDLEKNNPHKNLSYNKEKSFISLVNVNISEYIQNKELLQKFKSSISNTIKF